MIDLMNIHPMSEFNRNTKQYVQRLKETGKPEVLTVNGQAEVVVQSAAAYQKLLDAAELAETLAGIKRGLEEADRGALRTSKAFFQELAAKHGVELR